MFRKGNKRSLTFIKKVSDYSIAGGLSTLLLLSLAGCEDKPKENVNSLETIVNEAKETNSALVIIEETSQGYFKIAEEYKSNKSCVVIKYLNGTERVLQEQEIKAYLEEEKRVNPNSEISSTNNNISNIMLYSAIGGALGYWAGNSLFSSPTFMNQRSTYYKSTEVYNKSFGSFYKKEEERRYSGGGGYVASGASSSPASKVSSAPSAPATSVAKSSGFFSSSSSHSSSSGHGGSSSGG